MEKNDSNKKEESQNNKSDNINDTFFDILNSTNRDTPSEKNEKNCINCDKGLNIGKINANQLIISYNNTLTFINDCNNNNKISISLEANNDNNNKIKDDNNNTTNNN